MAVAILGLLSADLAVPLPLLLTRVPAGFPSPADDYVEALVDLNEICGVDGVATYLVRAEGDSMIEAGIWPGDVLVVDRAEEPRSGDVVIAAVCGELTIKRVRVEGGRQRRVWLVPENEAYAAVEVTAEMGLEVWGVVRFVLHGLRGRS